MSEREKHILFVKKLAQNEQDRSLHEIQDQIHQAEREERLVRTAAILVALIGLISTLGIGYSVIVLEDVFRNSTQAFMKLFSALSLGCLICLVGYLGYWGKRRAITNRLYEEARAHLLFLNEARLQQRSGFNGDIPVSFLDTSTRTHSRSPVSFDHSNPDLAQAA